MEFILEGTKDQKGFIPSPNIIAYCKRHFHEIQMKGGNGGRKETAKKK
jgi:hypothetical protein